MNIRVNVKSVVGLICGLALLGSLIHAQKSEAKDYYVSPNGSDLNQGTEADKPFKTIHTGARALQPGDTLWVMPGEYTGTLPFYGPPLDPSGTSWDKAVTIKAYDEKDRPT